MVSMATFFGTLLLLMPLGGGVKPFEDVGVLLEGWAPFVSASVCDFLGDASDDEFAEFSDVDLFPFKILGPIVD